MSTLGSMGDPKAEEPTGVDVSAWLSENDTEDEPDTLPDPSEHEVEEEETPEGEETPEVEPEAEAEGDTEPAAVEERDGDYEDAVTALRALKVPKAVLERMSREEVLAWGLDRSKAEKSTRERFDAHSREVKELKEQLAEHKSAGEEGRHVESPLWNSRRGTWCGGQGVFLCVRRLGG